MPKQDIRMNEAEIDRFLCSQNTVMVIAIAGEGAPQGAVGRLDYDGRVAFSLRDDDPVVSLLAADNRACCLVEQFPSFYEIVGVMLHVHAQRHEKTQAGEATFDLDIDKVVSF